MPDKTIRLIARRPVEPGRSDGYEYRCQVRGCETARAEIVTVKQSRREFDLSMCAEHAEQACEIYQPHPTLCRVGQQAQ